mmetsp:Transcript_121918/g.289914  ORF Transcript_121918/g.289914 Transcript_121918/m.289914 type:complete len:80 (+) Transcript_121918:808-1047(+)
MPEGSGSPGTQQAFCFFKRKKKRKTAMKKLLSERAFRIIDYLRWKTQYGRGPAGDEMFAKGLASLVPNLQDIGNHEFWV